jgi:hypothetical protein
VGSEAEGYSVNALITFDAALNIVSTDFCRWNLVQTAESRKFIDSLTGQISSVLNPIQSLITGSSASTLLAAV